MIGTGIIGFLLTCIVIAAGLWLLWYLVNPSPIPGNIKYALYLLAFIVVVIWFAKIVVPAMGLSL